MKVLVIDDEEDTRSIVKLSLSLIDNIEIIEAANGVSGLALAKSENPDIILLDMIMPHMDGKSTLIELNKDIATKHIPVVILTTKSTIKDINSMKDLGAKHVLTKPFDPMTLVEEIKQIVAI
jgi:DNA-binding response OmpR family regulator